MENQCVAARAGAGRSIVVKYLDKYDRENAPPTRPGPLDDGGPCRPALHPHFPAFHNRLFCRKTIDRRA
jgi:hypothetical protein